MDLSDALDFARSNQRSVLSTIRSSGRPQLSNVVHVVSDDGLLRISITANRAKYKNVQRVPWTALHVTRADFFAYVVIECTAELSPVAARPDDETVEELVRYYRTRAGEHENWDHYRQTMVDDRRVIIRLRPERAYGLLPAKQT